MRRHCEAGTGRNPEETRKGFPHARVGGLMTEEQLIEAIELVMMTVGEGAEWKSWDELRHQVEEHGITDLNELWLRMEQNADRAERECAYQARRMAAFRAIAMWLKGREVSDDAV